MLTRTIKRAILETQWQPTSLPPTFLLPLRARLTKISHTTDPAPPPGPLSTHPNYQPITSFRPPTSSLTTSTNSSTISNTPITPPPPLPPSTSHALTPSTPLTPTIRSLLPLLRAQSSHYITAHIHSRPYLLTPGDTLRLPFHMPSVQPGDILRLNRASVLGSRDYTLQAGSAAGERIPGRLGNGKKAYLDERLFVCRARVVAVDSEPMRVMEKTKRRQRHVKHARSKMRFTVLRVMEVGIRSVEEVEGEVEMEGTRG
ncbi:Ribosomal protein L21-like [Lasallia pustulata]|uniref:Large ribosomal subunit protein bL21m n=1 Tax=Lasallia pustulata TaxID=136370 RepID=A0A1W5DC31_9LECA|nr:Ribosomal protein L21-like [Lasallia pustulata]